MRSCAAAFLVLMAAASACESRISNVDGRSQTITTTLDGTAPSIARVTFRADGSDGTNEGYGEIFLDAEPSTNTIVRFTPECTGTQAQPGHFDDNFDIAIPVARVNLHLDLPFETFCELRIEAPNAVEDESIAVEWFASAYVVIAGPGKDAVVAVLADVGPDR